MSTSTTKGCSHIAEEIAPAQAETCQGCGSTYNLRQCTECGYVACCESQQAHNREHYRQSGHSVIKSYPVGPASFTWCYDCGRYIR